VDIWNINEDKGGTEGETMHDIELVFGGQGC